MNRTTRTVIHDKFDSIRYSWEIAMLTCMLQSQILFLIYLLTDSTLAGIATGILFLGAIYTHKKVFNNSGKTSNTDGHI